MKTLILACVALAGIVAVSADDKEAQQVVKKAFFKDVPGPPKSSGLRIWNGQVAAAGQFPYYVAVYIDMSAFCGGSLIHPKWVLTAAHCVDGGSFWTMFMNVLTMTPAKADGREVHISRGGILHPMYDRSIISNDVGLVQLLNRVTSGIPPVALTPPGMNYMGENATVAGFGITSDQAKTISDVLRYTTMPIVSSDYCYDRYGSADESQICLDTSEVLSSSCSGDSGGPLVLYDANNVPTQIGATSFGASAGCAKGLPVGFSNLTIFIDWIAETTGIPYPFHVQQ